MRKRVLIIGWDCAAPELVFEAFKDDMPNTRRLMEEGIYGELEALSHLSPFLRGCA